MRPWPALPYVISDAGTGLLAGIAQMQQDRRQSEQVPLDNGLEVFHTQQEAQRVLRILWSRVERLWEQAEAASRAVELAQRQGCDARGLARRASAAWKRVAAAFRRSEEAETAWRRAESALSRFRPDGRLNDRAWAEAEMAAALPGLSGPEWSKVRGFLAAPAALTFWDRLHGQLGQLVLATELRDALVQLWWLRRQRPRGSNPQARAGYGTVAPLVQQLLCQQLDPNWRASYRQVTAVLGRAVRASSAVECMHSVLRMHQSRHRTITQGMLDLKRLYWNTRVFRGGKRKGLCPYEHLGLKQPDLDFGSWLEGEVNRALSEAKAKAQEKRRAA